MTFGAAFSLGSKQRSTGSAGRRGRGPHAPATGPGRVRSGGRRPCTAPRRRSWGRPAWASLGAHGGRGGGGGWRLRCPASAGVWFTFPVVGCWPRFFLPAPPTPGGTSFDPLALWPDNGHFRGKLAGSGCYGQTPTAQAPPQVEWNATLNVRICKY